MVVDQDKSVSGMIDNSFEDFPWMSQRLIERAHGNLQLLKQPEFRIQEGDCQHFAVELHEFSGK